MGLLDQITGALGQQANAAPGQSGAMQMVLAMINQHPGGMQGLIQALMAGGLAQHVQSWIGTGSNLPISAEQLQSVLGGGKLALADVLCLNGGQRVQSQFRSGPISNELCLAHACSTIHRMRCARSRRLTP